MHIFVLDILYLDKQLVSLWAQLQPHFLQTFFYTKIPHDKLIDVLSSIVDSTYNDATRKYMSVGNKIAYCVKGIRNARFLYSANVVKDCLIFLIKNAYFCVGNLVFRQVIGIPMGSDAAPFFAILFLYKNPSR